MKQETKHALQRALAWSALLATVYFSVALYAAANRMSLDLGGAIAAAPVMLPIMVDVFTASVLRSFHRLFLGEVWEIHISVIALRSILIGLMWGLGFLWPHLAYRKTKEKPFLIWQWSFLAWCAISIVGPMVLMMWAMSGMD